MTDPAIAAALKVLAQWSDDGEPDGAERYLAVAAAREALEPIRQKWEELSEAATNLSEHGSYLESAKAAGMREVLAELVPFIFYLTIFTTEELER